MDSIYGKRKQKTRKYFRKCSFLLKNLTHPEVIHDSCAASYLHTQYLATQGSLFLVFHCPKLAFTIFLSPPPLALWSPHSNDVLHLHQPLEKRINL